MKTYINKKSTTLILCIVLFFLTIFYGPSLLIYTLAYIIGPPPSDRIRYAYDTYGAKGGETFLENRARSGHYKDAYVYLLYKSDHRRDLGYTDDDIANFEFAAYSCPPFQKSLKNRQGLYDSFKRSRTAKYAKVAACVDAHKNDFNPYSDDNWRRCKVVESSPPCPIKMDRPPPKTLSNLWGLIEWPD